MQTFLLRGMLVTPGDYSLTGITLLLAPPGEDPSWLLAGSSVSGAQNLMRLTEGAIASVVSVSWMTDRSGVPMSDGLSLTQGDETRLLTANRFSGAVTLQSLGPEGQPGTASPLRTVAGQLVQASQIESLTVGGRSYLATSGPGGAGVSLYEVQDSWRVLPTASQNDTPKSTAQAISDLVGVQVGGASFLVASSQSEAGLTSYAVGSGGSLSLIDSIRPADGLWVSGISLLRSVEVGTETYLIGGSPLGSTLVSVRLNPMGVFFVGDLVTDSRDTRFGGISALDLFETGGRDFLAAAGNDGGFSLFEILPGGRFLHHQSLEQTTAWTLGSVSGLRAVIVGGEVQLFVAGYSGGVAQFALPVTSLGARQVGSAAADALTGTAGNDVVLGLAGNDTLSGGKGDDTLIADTGADRLTGGAGADVFVFAGDGQADVVTDFQFGTDRLDLGDWGRIYDVSALDITMRGTEATIRWQNEAVVVTLDGPTGIAADDWSAANFLF